MGAAPLKHEPGASDAEAVARAAQVLAGGGDVAWYRRFTPFLGPAFWPPRLRRPGELRTNVQGGAEFGYLLLWVIVASNLMAMLIQLLSAKLGIATGRNLAEVCRDSFSRPVVWGMWVVAELVAMATDLAEFVGAAVGFNLLFGIPLFPAALLTGVATFLILGLQRSGFRPLEAVITAMVGVIALSYLIETLLEQHDWAALLRGDGATLRGEGSVVLAVGMLGATVMPHVIFLHSSLTQHRIRPTSPVRPGVCTASSFWTWGWVWVWPASSTPPCSSWPPPPSTPGASPE